MPNFITGNIEISPLLNAHVFLTKAIKEAKTELEKAGAIQAFEFCYELSWKYMKRILAFRGIEVSSPREVFRAAAQEKLISDVEFWFEVIKKRNLTVHSYQRTVAEEIFQFLPQFKDVFDLFIESLNKMKTSHET